MKTLATTLLLVLASLAFAAPGASAGCSDGSPVCVLDGPPGCHDHCQVVCVLDACFITWSTGGDCTVKVGSKCYDGIVQELLSGSS